MAVKVILNTIVGLGILGGAGAYLTMTRIELGPQHDEAAQVIREHKAERDELIRKGQAEAKEIRERLWKNVPDGILLPMERDRTAPRVAPAPVPAPREG